MKQVSLGTVLLLADRRQNSTSKAIRNAGFQLLTTFTADHAVAICVGTQVDAVVLDQEHFVVTEGWSVAQSLKMIHNKMCVLLIVRGQILGKKLPAGVDAVVPEGDINRLLRTLKDLL